MVEEAQAKAPHDYVARLLAQRQPREPVDLVDGAERKLAEAGGGDTSVRCKAPPAPVGTGVAGGEVSER